MYVYGYVHSEARQLTELLSHLTYNNEVAQREVFWHRTENGIIYLTNVAAQVCEIQVTYNKLWDYRREDNTIIMSTA